MGETDRVRVERRDTPTQLQRVQRRRYMGEVCGGWAMKSKNQLWALAHREVIPDLYTDAAYLTRFRVIQTPWFAIYIHQIHMSDNDRGVHDHPWNFHSIILRGGYVEKLRGKRTCNTYRKWMRWSHHYMRAEQAHQITYVKPGTVSLILVGRRRREWGFYVSRCVDYDRDEWTDDWIPWKQYVEQVRFTRDLTWE